MDRNKAENLAISGQHERFTNFVNGKAPGPVNAPQFPGMQTGLSIEQVRSWIKRQKRYAGFRIPLGTGGNPDVTLDIPGGNARIWLGWSVSVINPTPGIPAPIDPDINLLINTELVITRANYRFFAQENMDEDYYYFPRPLSGTDKIKVNALNNGAAGTLLIKVAYI